MSSPSALDPCPVCAGTLVIRHEHVPSASQQIFSVARCTHCGHGVTLSTAPDQAVEHDTQYGFNRHGFTAAWCAQRRARWVRRLTGTEAPHKVLDIGCGDGRFLATMRHAGWKVAGIERHEHAAALAHLNVSTHLDDAAQQAPFGAITLWHSLEHFDDPLELLAECRALLHPMGSVFVAVPDATCTAAKLFGKHWLHWDVAHHRSHFSATSLNLTARAAGLSLQATLGPELEYEWLGWSQSLLDALGWPRHAFFDALRGAPQSGGAAKRALHLLAGGVASSLTALPVLATTLAAQRTHVVFAQDRSSSPAPH